MEEDPRMERDTSPYRENLEVSPSIIMGKGVLLLLPLLGFFQVSRDYDAMYVLVETVSEGVTSPSSIP